MRRTPNEEIPTLFEREYAGHKVVGIKDTVTRVWSGYWTVRARLP
jgi:hypothetical protein